MYKLIFFIIIILPLKLSAYISDEAIFTKGLNYYIQREFKLAAEEWKKLLDRNPEHSRAKIYMEKAYAKYNEMEINFYKGLGLFVKEQYCESIPFFKTTLMINPRHEKATYYIKIAYDLCNKLKDKKAVASELLSEADKYSKEDEYVKAIGLYKIALLLDPENEHIKYKLTEIQKSEIEYNKNLELMLHIQAAREYHNKEQYLEAIQEWSKALMIDPDNIEAKEGLKLDQELLKQQQLKQKINELLAKGIEQFMNSEYLNAKETFNKVLELDPNNQTAKDYLKKIDEILSKIANQKIIEDEAEKHFILGVNFFNNKDYNSALNEFNITLDLKPDHQKAIEYKNKILEILEKLRKEQESANNEKIQKLLNEGIKFYKAGEFELAIEKFNEVLKLDPENEYAQEYLKLALQALQLQKESEVKEDSPYYIIVKNLENEGKKYLDKKEYSLALHFFEQIKELFPLNKIANKFILKIMFITDKPSAQKILDSHFEQGKESYNNKNYLKALYEFQLVKEIDPNYPEIDKYISLAKNPPSLYEKEISQHYNMGLYYYSQNDYEKALAEWKKVIELDNSPLSNKYLGETLANIAKAEYKLKLKKGSTGEIIAKTQETSSEKKQKINKHYYLGVAYYTSGNYQEAYKEWQEVLKLDPYHSQTLINIEKCKKRLNLK